MLHYIKLHPILNIINSSTEETQSVSMYLLKPTLNFDIIHKTCESTQNTVKKVDASIGVTRTF